MTLEKLSAHYNRLEYLAELQETLEGLRRSAQPRTQVFTGMPHAGGVSDRVGDLAVEIAYMEAEIKALQEEIAVHEATILSFIQSIPDPRTRTIFRPRFLRGLQWKEVAGAIGGRNSISAVKAICYRFIQKQEGAQRAGQSD